MITLPRREFLTRLSGLAATSVIPATAVAVARPMAEMEPISIEARRDQLVVELLAIQKKLSPGAWDVRFDMHPDGERYLTFSKRCENIVYAR